MCSYAVIHDEVSGIEGLREEIGRVPGVDARRPELDHAARVRRRDHRSRSARARAAARRPCGRGSRATARGCITAYAPPAPQQSPSSAVSTSVYAGASTVRTARCGLLYVPQVARILHDDPAARSGAAAAAGCVASHSEKSTTRALNACASGVSRRSPYSFIAAPHPALSTTTGAEPGIDAIDLARRAHAPRPPDPRAGAARRSTPRSRAAARSSRRWRA